MKTRILFLCLLFAILVSFSACTISVNGTDVTDEVLGVHTETSGGSADSAGFVMSSNPEWVISPNEAIVYDENHNYFHRVTANVPVVLAPASVYEYANGLSLDEDFPEVVLYAPYHNAPLLWFEDLDGITRIYVSGTRLDYYEQLFTDKSKKDIRFCDNNGRYSEHQSIDLLLKLNLDYKISSAYFTVRASDLTDATRYEILQFDDTESIAVACGMIFEIDNEYFYIDYRSLSGQYFDVSGRFTLLGGTIELAPISSRTADEIEEATSHMEFRVTDYSYESTPMPIGLFWVCYIFLGFLVPIPFIALGFILPHIAKFGRPKYWYVTAYLGIAWFVLAFVLMFLLI